MKFHVQNPWTKKPSLMINMSVEHVQQLKTALEKAFGDQRGTLTDNQVDAVNELRRQLKHALNTDLPHGIKDVVP